MSDSDLKPFSIFGLGTILVDHQVMMAGLPAADTKGEVITDRYQVGGPVPTALTLLRKLGMQATFLGRWAPDPFGSMIEEDLNRHGIDFCAPPNNIDARTGFAHVWVDQGSGSRSIAAYRGSHPVDPQQIGQHPIHHHDALHLDGWSGPAAVAAATAMQLTGGRVFVDLGSRKPDLAALLQHVNFLNCPARLIPQLFATEDLGKGARQLLAMGPSEVTVTSGDQGALYVSAECEIRQAAFPVEAVDTNGAGDVFAGAMIFATMQGWAPAERLRFACAASALKCTELGNRDALPTLAQIQRFLATQLSHADVHDSGAASDPSVGETGG